MEQSEQYRQNAAKCLKLADEVGDQTVRLGLIDMAQRWQTLAEQAEKNSQAEQTNNRPTGRRANGQQATGN